MKTIIVPTDFSVPAENAMLYAGQVAQTIQASVLLVHVYQVPVSMNDVPVMMVSAEELKKSADAGLERTKEVLKAAYPLLEVSIESRLGDITEELRDLAAEIHPATVVIGKHGATGMERILFGSTSLSIIRQVQVPVIVVPDSTTKRQLKNIALAVDDLRYPVPQQNIKTLMEQLGAQLHIIHVQTDKKESADFNALATAFNTSCTLIRDEEFVHGIQSYVRENNIDLLIILPHKHSLMERLFFKTHTKELMQALSIPLMCMHEESV
jgi:nucleotide-binding universal stress UspA family protein